ncbi:MAG: hypothetical protein UU43_C0007G0005 [Candidatus Falkowbacteria bacterium GW2011_GWA2_41_14]|uniref:Uncharacterized protein n=1 Tax=Candidatus Falkowbacteria bacterium GW2011_GWA2_41_14 TaxID=1618635 RepID=A0A0G0UV28_9BACT|nr:MAG: hypothetical protein UU43_C0007G0005 [Candidatus Falkowbacteria bacterium GW2011_GWA2_41_14]
MTIQNVKYLRLNNFRFSIVILHFEIFILNFHEQN